MDLNDKGASVKLVSIVTVIVAIGFLTVWGGLEAINIFVPAEY